MYNICEGTKKSLKNYNLTFTCRTAVYCKTVNDLKINVFRTTDFLGGGGGGDLASAKNFHSLILKKVDTFLSEMKFKIFQSPPPPKVNWPSPNKIRS